MKRAIEYDIIIIGAGPAGATCALQLRHSGLRVLLIDKATFPREKICGDAIVGRSIKTLFACCPEMANDFRQFLGKARTTNTRLNINGKKPFDIHWVNEAYCCKRVDFDNYLINAVRQYASNVTILEDFAVDWVEKSLNEDDTNFSKKEISLNSIAKLEKKLKQLEHCQNLQNSLLLNKLMNKQKIITNDLLTTKSMGPSDMFSSEYSCTGSNENEHSVLSFTNHSISNGNQDIRKNQKWTLEEVTKLNYMMFILNSYCYNKLHL